MGYLRQTWADSPATTSPLNAARLNHMEIGIEAAAQAADIVEIPVGLPGPGELGLDPNDTAKLLFNNGTVIFEVLHTGNVEPAVRTVYPRLSTFTAATGATVRGLIESDEYVRFLGDVAATYHLPAASVLDVPNGFVVTLRQAGSAVVTVTSASGVVALGNKKTAGIHTDITVIKLNDTTWDVSGGVP